MRRIIFFAFAIVFLGSCVGNKAKLVVEVAAIKDGKVELRYVTPDVGQGEVVDTLYKGSFKDGKISIALDNLDYNDGRKDCMLLITDNEQMKGAYLPVVLEKGRTITLLIPEGNTSKITYSGTTHAEDFTKFWNVLQKESMNMNQRNANLSAVYGNMEKAFRTYIEEYPEAEIPFILLTFIAKSMREDTQNPLLAYCNELCIESKSDNKWRNTFCDVLKSLQLARITATRLVFTAQDANDKIYSERDIKGKVILIDFWASWCKPCKDEIPHLAELYDKYKEQGLTIVSISMDAEPQKWLSYITNHPMKWLSLRGEGQTLSDRYGIEYIPFNLICDSEGNVIKKNLHGASLDAAIEEMINKQ
ncbi:MAG: TlpA family protein disulfide reductase [Bacteroidales bacterium]|nr:TlpA family protein disulfide reductase [Bacteroidales bacterium]